MQNIQDTKPHTATMTPGFHLEAQCTRILACTAQFFASSPGGLRFKAGTQPWLAAISAQRPATANLA